MLARLKGPFDVIPQLAYSKTIAKSDKKPSRHLVRILSMKRLFIEKDQATELKRF